MDEPRMDEWIRAALEESRLPPEAPLDEMWANVERAHFDRVAVVLPWRSRPTARWAARVLPAAAALVIGVGIGRQSIHQNDNSSASLAATQSSGAVAAGTKAASPTPTTIGREDPTPSSRAVATGSRRPDISSAAGRNAQPVPSEAVSTSASLLLASRDRSDAYSPEMSRYLLQTAALLATLPSNGRSAASDQVINRRASTLLTQTHLLLDSGAGSDPTLHTLLEDLELVLAQVARLHPAQNNTDLELIHEALKQHDVLPRLHDATVEAASTD